MKRIVPMVLVLLVVAVASDSALAASVQGFVARGQGTPATNVRIELGRYSAFTDESGNFGMWVDPGIYPLRVMIQGCDGPSALRVKVNGQRSDPSRILVTAQGRTWIEIRCRH
jgi:uncharacterized membrane protein